MPEIPAYSFNKHLRRRAIYRYNRGTVVVDLFNVWYVHSFRNGIRMLYTHTFLMDEASRWA